MKTLAAFLLSLVFAVVLLAQDTPPTGGRPASPPRIVTRTRTVAVFGDLESKLMAAVEKKDAAALTQLATEDFELRRASAPSQPVPRDQWIAQELPTYELHNFRISQMAVHLYSDVAVVSMNYWQSATVNGKDRTGDFFIVDLWTKNDNDWKLSVRYVSPTDIKAAPSREDKKPTGKQ